MAGNAVTPTSLSGRLNFIFITYSLVKQHDTTKTGKFPENHDCKFDILYKS